LLLLVKKMGSRQKAVEAFLAVCDDSMLGRWIPDDDWVRHIRDNGKNDCLITNLSMGMSRPCVWQNNHASLQARTVFHKKKKIRISKNKVANKHIEFYYCILGIWASEHPYTVLAKLYLPITYRYVH
jgi:hypothetical protein